MDRMSVSEADDTGSIPVGCTNYLTYNLNFQEFNLLSQPVRITYPFLFNLKY